jgi:hypothetical protein
MPERNRNNWWLRPGHQLLALVGVVVVIAALVVAFATLGSPRKDTLAYDARYLAIQFLLLTGLGAIVAFLIDLERRMREAREQRRKFEIETVSSLLDQLDQIYSHVKTTRRLLRIDEARAELDDARLIERMLQVNDQQEEVERLRKRVDALKEQMSDLAQIGSDVERFDNYLSSLWGDYEDSPMPGEWLEPFIATQRSGDSDFEKFKGPYDDARGKLIGLLGVVSTEAR